MTARDDLDRRLDAFLQDGPTELPESSYYAVRDRTESTRQRVIIGPWRLPTMNKLVPIALGAGAIVAIIAIGIQVLGPAPTSGVGGPPAATPTATPSPDPLRGTVQFLGDGAPATTEIDAVADGSSMSGTAVTTFASGTHTVRLECAARDGDTWAFAGTVEQTTVPAESAGHWSAVIVRDGAPQKIAIWLSDGKTEGIDCEGWLAGIDLSTMGADNFELVESGVLLPPPDLAP